MEERCGFKAEGLQGKVKVKVDEIIYSGSTVQSNGGCGRKVRKKEQVGWSRGEKSDSGDM